MKYKLKIDNTHEEEIIIYAHEVTPVVEEILSILKGNRSDLIAYTEKGMVKLSLQEIYCFTIEGKKLYALTENEKLLIKQRLYQIEELTDNDFLKINQSTIINIRKIKRFDTSLSGSLLVVLKNGYKDYVSRRQLKFVKERIGL